VLGHERDHLTAGLQDRHVGVQVDPVQALDIQHRMPGQDLIDRHHARAHGSLPAHTSCREHPPPRPTRPGRNQCCAIAAKPRPPRASSDRSASTKPVTARTVVTSPATRLAGPRLPSVVHQLLVAAGAIERADSTALGLVGGILKTARAEGFLNTVVTTAPQVTSYLIEHLSQMRQDPYIRRLSEAAMAVRDGQRGAVKSGGLIEPLTEAELQILRLLPTSSNQQIAATLYVSRNTVKTHLRAIYRKLGVASRSDAIARALERCLI
jgi:DNA-binding CsgD family transcriptional regulator